MYPRSISIVASALALSCGCGDATDTRPETVAYITEAILAPSCGRGACHSSETKAHNYAFDTIPAAIAAMSTSDHGHTLVVAGDPENSELVTILTSTSEPMPEDAPLPDVDIDLISRWVADGAEGL